MKLDDLLTLLEDADCGSIGKTIFEASMPAATTNGLLLRSKLTGTPIDYELPGFFRGGFQMIVRTPGSSYEVGEALADNALAALTIDRETQLETMFVRYCRPLHLPIAFPTSNADLIEFSVNFEICFELTT